jgi:hypothetical protein
MAAHLNLDEALARQAEMIAELRAERDEAFRRCDRLNGKLASQKRQVDEATRQRDLLAARLSSILQIELSKQEREQQRRAQQRSEGQLAGDARPATAATYTRSDSPRPWSNAQPHCARTVYDPREGVRRRAQSAPSKRVVMTDKLRDAMTERLYKTSIAGKKEALAELDKKFYKEMEEKRQGKQLKTKAEYDENLKQVYTNQIIQRDKARKELEKIRADEARRKAIVLSRQELERSVARMSSPYPPKEERSGIASRSQIHI